MLDEHQVRLLARLRHEGVEPTVELQVCSLVVLAERRIGDDAVKGPKLVLVEMLGVFDGVALADVRRDDAMKDHVHAADGPGRPVVFLPQQFEVAGVAADLFNERLGLDEHAARTHAGVVDAHAIGGFDQLDEGANDFGRSKKLAALFACRVGKELDQVLVGRAKEVGELEVLVAEGDGVEVLDQFNKDFVIEGLLPDLLVEVDALEDILKGVGVGVFDGGEGFVELVADVGLDVPNFFPERLFRDEECVLVGVCEQLLDDGGLGPLGLQVGLHGGSVGKKLIAHPLQEEHAENELLEVGGVHLAALDIAGGEEEAFELGKGQFLSHRGPECPEMGVRRKTGYQRP